MSSNEKEEEEEERKKKLAYDYINAYASHRIKKLDGTRVELGCEMRCEAYLCFFVESINDFEIFHTKCEKDITRILAKRTLSVSINALLEKSFD